MANIKKKQLISIIVPCFNEEDVLPFFYQETTKVLKDMPYNYELIFVNDGSNDKTLHILKDFAKKNKNVFYLSFSRNFGKESAMYAGLRNASGDYIGFMDADLQHPPKYIKQMIEALKSKEYDCAACRRINRAGESKIRTWFSKLFYKLVNGISDSAMMDGAGDFRFMKKEMATALLAVDEYNRFSKGLFSWVGFKTYWIEYENVERYAGKTSWSFWGLLKYAIDGIVSFSNAPLYLASVFGIVSMLFAFIYLTFIVIKYALFGDPVQGWATTVSVILLLGGIQLFSLGIIGQYIGKMYMEVKDRPHYIVAESNKKDAQKIG